MTDTLRVGIIGAGANTRSRHIPGLRAIPGVEVVAVCNRSLPSAQKVCKDMNIPRACANPQEIFEDGDIDAVVIGTWPYKHCQYTVAALESGKHVMCEARMAMNAAEGEKMLAAARAHPQLVAQIVPAPFTLGVDEQFTQLVREQLGRIVRVHMEFATRDDGVLLPQRTWRRNRSYSGNNIMGVGIWYESLMRWTGPVAWVQAVLHTHRPVGIDPDTSRQVPIDVPDHVEALGELAAGGTFSLYSSCIATQHNRKLISIQGERGTLLMDEDKHTFTPLGGSPQVIEPNPAHGWRVEAEFIGAIRGSETIRLTDFDTALAYMRFMDALHESHRLAQPVKVTG